MKGKAENFSSRYIAFRALCAAADDSCVEEGLELRKQAEKAGDQDSINLINVDLANFFIDVQSRFDYAADFLKACIDKLDVNRNFEDMAGHYLSIGRAYNLLGRYIESINAYKETINLLEGKTLTAKGNRRLGTGYQNVSASFFELQMNVSGEAYLNKALALATETNDNYNTMLCHNNMAHFCEKSGNGENKAAEHYLAAIEIAKNHPDKQLLMVFTSNLGNYYCRRNKIEKGLALLQHSLELAENLPNKRLHCNVLHQYADGLMAAGRYAEANEYFERANKLFIESASEINHLDFYKQWAECLRKLGHTNEAFEKYDMYDQHREKLRYFNNAFAGSEAKLLLAIEEGKRETEMLQKKNAEIADYAHRLEITNSELQQFTHVASHDLKEPLRALTNYSKLLEKSMPDDMNEEQKVYLKFISDGGKRMMQVINDLLLLSKINPQFAPGPVDVKNVLDQVLGDAAILIDKSEAIIVLSDMPVIRADEEHMYLLFLHLITNAIQHNSGKQLRIEVRYAIEKDHHRFEVHDNGKGIEEPYRTKVFELFQRLHNRQEHDGNGIGLAICKKICDYMHGEIFIEQSPMGGACVVVQLPV